MTERVTYTFDVDRAVLEREVQPFLRRRAGRLTRRIATQARADVPVKTGFLGRSIREDPIVSVGPFRVESGVTATAYYAGFVHNGTRFMRRRPFLANAATRVMASEQ